HVEGDAETVERTLAETYETWASRPFDLGRGPLWRILLAHTPGGRAQLMLAIHHLVADGSSMAVFMRDVNELYRAALEQREAALPPLTIQYGDYAVRQVEDEGRLREELDYWRARLADLPRPLDLPADYVR